MSSMIYKLRAEKWLGGQNLLVHSRNIVHRNKSQMLVSDTAFSKSVVKTQALKIFLGATLESNSEHSFEDSRTFVNTRINQIRGIKSNIF